MRIGEGKGIMRGPVTGFNGVARSGGWRNGNGRKVWASTRAGGRLRTGPGGVKVVDLTFINVGGSGETAGP